MSELDGFADLVEQEFGYAAKVCNANTIGVRHNKFSSSFGTIKYFNDKLSLRGKHYNMVTAEDVEILKSIDPKATINDSMISKVFGHFFVD